MSTLELLQRNEAGAVTLEGVPIREWYERQRVVPIRETYTGTREGKRGLCLLGTLAFVKLGRDGDALDRRLDALGPPGPLDHAHPQARGVLIDLIGIDLLPSRALESGWWSHPGHRDYFDGLGLAAEWDLGRDAWLAVRPATEPEPRREYTRPEWDRLWAVNNAPPMSFADFLAADRPPSGIRTEPYRDHAPGESSTLSIVPGRDLVGVRWDRLVIARESDPAVSVSLDGLIDFRPFRTVADLNLR